MSYYDRAIEALDAGLKIDPDNASRLRALAGDEGEIRAVGTPRERPRVRVCQEADGPARWLRSGGWHCRDLDVLKRLCRRREVGAS